MVVVNVNRRTWTMVHNNCVVQRVDGVCGYTTVVWNVNVEYHGQVEKQSGCEGSGWWYEDSDR